MFWDKGFGAMPPWIQRSVINCYRREGKQWTIRLLDTVPGSPNHVLNYTEEEDFPLAVTEARMTGNDASQKTSNFARLAVVYRVSVWEPITTWRVFVLLFLTSLITHETAWRNLHGRRNTSAS